LRGLGWPLRAQLTDAATRLAHHPLTGLLNRAGLVSRHAAMAAQPEPLPIVVVALTTSRPSTTPTTVATTCSSSIEAGAPLAELATVCGSAAARLSGDEFALVLPLAHTGPTESLR